MDFSLNTLAPSRPPRSLAETPLKGTVVNPRRKKTARKRKDCVDFGMVIGFYLVNWKTWSDLKSIDVLEFLCRGEPKSFLLLKAPRQVSVIERWSNRNITCSTRVFATAF